MIFKYLYYIAVIASTLVAGYCVVSLPKADGIILAAEEK